MPRETHTGEVIRLALIASDEAAIRDYEFSDCQINGPAVIFARGCEFAHCRFDGDSDAILWEVPLSRERVIGAILLEGCRFIGCRFSNVGIAGPPDAITEWRAGIAG